MLCRLCPRNCGVDRSEEKGYCRSGDRAKVAKVMLHKWEEPCISGERGSGAVFFSGCQLGCVYCQNRRISRSCIGTELCDGALATLFLRLEEAGAHNINLVTPDHFALNIKNAVAAARADGLSVPVVYNCSGYVHPQTLRMLEDTVDIYLTDFKYLDGAAAERYSACRDYTEAAKAALAEMVRQQPVPVFGADGMMKKGVIVRHLILPGHTADSKDIVSYLYKTYGDAIFMSLMNQFTPSGLEDYPELNRKLTTLEYNRVVGFADGIGVRNAYIQEGGTVSESFIPDFETGGDFLKGLC